MKIFVLTPNKEAVFSSESLSKIESLGEVVWDIHPKPFQEVPGLFEPGEKILAIDPDFCDWKFPNELLEKIPDLKGICLQTTSFNWIDTEMAHKVGIPVMNLRGFSTEGVAEWVLMMALNLARKIPLVIKEGWKVDFRRYLGIELKGKTAAVLGLGRIGKRIAELCNGAGMEVIYWSKSTRDSRFIFKELEELLKTADFIFPAWAKSDVTGKILTDERLKTIKKSAVFVGYGGPQATYNQDLLIKMVSEGNLFGYGFEAKAGSFNDYSGNVWAGPALGWVTQETMRRNGDQWADSIAKAVSGVYETQVN